MLVLLRSHPGQRTRKIAIAIQSKFTDETDLVRKGPRVQKQRWSRFLATQHEAVIFLLLALALQAVQVQLRGSPCLLFRRLFFRCQWLG